jgi:hypothetical protein
MHTNNSWASYVGSLPVHWTNVFQTSVFMNTFSYDTVCISKSWLMTLRLLQSWNSTGLPDIMLFFEHISYAVLPQSFTLFIIIYSSSTILFHKWVICFLGMFIPNESIPSTVPFGKVIFFSLFHKHQQNCIRSVYVSMSRTLFLTLKSGVDHIMCLAS